jgi:AraC-like DNA-binding protein
MPSSTVLTFTDPDDYAAAIRGSDTEFTILGRGQFVAKNIQIAFHRLWMQRFYDNLPRVGHRAASAILSGRVVVGFRTASGPPLIWGGSEMHTTRMVRHGEGDNTFHRSSGSFNWGSMSLPAADMDSVGAGMAGCDLMPPRDAMLIIPPASAMTKLQQLHAAAAQLAEDAPEIIAHPEAARGLEQALVSAMVECLAHQEQRETSLAQGQHAIVMRRFRRLIEENPEQPLYLAEICKAIRVPDRTLRRCCQEYLGMGPRRYLLLRRLHLVRRALRQAPPERTTVTDTATRFGFWQLGRLAVEYQSLFGESPSATLRSQPG